MTENVWKTSNFLKSAKGLLCTPHLVYSFFKFISYSLQREKDEYILNSPTNFRIPRYLVLIIQHAVTTKGLKEWQTSW